MRESRLDEIMSSYLVEQVAANPAITVRTSTQVVAGRDSTGPSARAGAGRPRRADWPQRPDGSGPAWNIGSVTNSSRRALATASTALLALALFGCSSGADPAPDVAASGDGTESPADPQEPTYPDEGAPSGQAVYGVADTFALSNVGEYEATYLGLADLGTADGGSVGEVHCYAVLAELTLITEPSVGGGGWIPSNESVFDAGGTAIGTHVTLGCPISPLLDSGYTPAESIDWVQGVAHDVSLVMAAVPVGSEDAMAEVELSNRDGFRLAAEVTETF